VNGLRRLMTTEGWGLFLVTLLGLPLITPLWQWVNVPCTHDGHLYYHLLAAIRHSWDNGLLYARWLPDLAFGYGYPYFLFREVTPLYLALFPHLLGLPLPATSNLFYALCILASGWFMLLWVRDVLDGPSAVVAAVAYMAAPYQLIDALVRGNQPESLALPLFPLLLWAGRRYVVQGTARPLLASTLGLLLLALSHNISLLLFTPLLFVYLLLVGWWRRLTWRTVFLRLGLVFGLGLGLSAFYVGPALLELDQITISQSVTTRNNDFRFNFASLAEILAPVQAADPELINPPLLIRLGWMPLGLAGLGLLLGLDSRPERERRGHLLAMALAASGLVFMSLPVSQSLWEGLPLLKFVQFPWRLIGRAALPVAFLAGAGVYGLGQLWPRRADWRPIFVAGAVLLLLLEALPNLYPRVCYQEPFPTIQTVHNYERVTGFVGVDPEGSYFPKAVQIRPDGSPLETDYQAGRPPQRLDKAALPEGIGLVNVQYEPLSMAAEVDSPTAFQARYLTFTFPGWQAAVDGRTVPITASDPDGLITFPVPAGRHTLTVQWRMTPLRQATVAVSLLSLLALAAAAWRSRSPRPVAANAPVQRAAADWSRPALIGLLLVAGLVLALKLAVVDRTATPFRRPAGPPIGTATDVTAGGLNLTGFNLSQGAVVGGSTFDIDLAWRALAPPPAAYQSNVWLVDEAGLIWSEKETYRPRIYEDAPPTAAWQPGQWAWDSREVQVLSGTPPGRYDIVLTLFDLADLQPLTLTASDGTVLGPVAVIGQIEVTRPDEPAAFRPQFPLDEKVAGLTLLGYNQDRQEARPGDLLLLTLFWQIGGEPVPGKLSLSLVDGAGESVQEWSIAPVNAGYAACPDCWAAGERLRGQHLLRLAAGLNSGDYQFELAGVPLGRLAVRAPDRLYEPPTFEHPLGADFSGLAGLAGYSLAPAGDELRLTLVWRGLAEMATSYRVFVHLVDESGQIAAQSDGEPAGWTRPTTGWVPGEYVIDMHSLALPADWGSADYQLRVGLYDPDSGRLETAGGDTVRIPLERPADGWDRPHKWPGRWPKGSTNKLTQKKKR
jgi:hypothetical protein